MTRTQLIARLRMAGYKNDGIEYQTILMMGRLSDKVIKREWNKGKSRKAQDLAVERPLQEIANDAAEMLAYRIARGWLSSKST